MVRSAGLVARGWDPAACPALLVMKRVRDAKQSEGVRGAERREELESKNGAIHQMSRLAREDQHAP